MRTFAWLLLLLLSTAGALPVTQASCQTTEKSYNITSGVLIVKCTVPPELAHAESSEVVWSVDPPFSLLGCETNSVKTQLTCSADVMEGATGTAAAQYFIISISNSVCIYQCLFNINTHPHSSSPSPPSPSPPSPSPSPPSPSLPNSEGTRTASITSPSISPSPSHLSPSPSHLSPSPSHLSRSTLQPSSEETPTVVATITASPPLEVWQNVVVAVTTTGILITILLIVGSSILGLLMWKRKTAPSTKEEKDTEGVDSGFLIGMEQDLFNAKESSAGISFSSIILHELIHKGTFKLVHRAMHQSTDVVVKRLKDPTSEAGREELVHEIETMQQLTKTAGKCPHIVSLVGVTEGKPLCLLLEYVPHGTLQMFLRQLRSGPIPTWYINHLKSAVTDQYHKHVVQDLMSVLVQVANAGMFLAEHNFVHGDITTRNVLLGNNLLVKLTNFGIQKGGGYFEETGRPEFLQHMAPETIENVEYTNKSDVWSFGILIFQAATLESIEPYKDLRTRDDLYKRMCDGERPQAFSCFSSDLHFLLQQCWQFDPSGRLTFSKLYERLWKLSQNPANHISLKVSARRKGYVAKSGQVFLNPPPNSIMQRKLSTKATPNSVSIEALQDSADVSAEDSGLDSFSSQVAEDQVKPSSSVEKPAGKKSTSSLVWRSTHNSRVAEDHLCHAGWTTQITQDEDGEYRIVRSLNTHNPASHNQELSPLLGDPVAPSATAGVLV